jgi:LDH2 family malate/lactate/ureidoglycolate dehydrogenase
MYEELNKPRNLGHFMLALDPARFADRNAFVSQVGLFLDEIRAEGALAPGDPERLSAERRGREGIPLGAATVEELNRLAAELGVTQL